MALLALEFSDELVAHERAFLVAGHLCQLAGELGEADGWVDDHRLHCGEALQGFVDLHCIEDAEGLFTNLLAQTRRAAKHLIEQDAAVHPAQENEVTDFGYIHAGGQQVHRDGDVRVTLVL